MLPMKNMDLKCILQPYVKATVLTLYGHIKTAEQRTIIQQYSDLVCWTLMGGPLHLVQ